MSDSNNEVERPTERSVDRRLLLRGGAVLAGAAGVAVVGAAMGPTAAHAADGDNVILGETNEATSTTRLNFGGPDGSATPALHVSNPSGPVLSFTPTGDDYSGVLKPGELAATPQGPEIGVVTEDGPRTTWLATGLDLDQIPFTLPIPPERLVDTRTAGGREGIRASAAGAFNAQHQLVAGHWFDVALTESDFEGLGGAYINVTAVAPVTAGYVTAYPPGKRPGTSTLNFPKGQTIANGALIMAGIADEDEDWWVIRIYSSATTHVVVDLTGVSLYGFSGSQEAAAGTAKQRKAVKSNRMARTFQGR